MCADPRIVIERHASAWKRYYATDADNLPEDDVYDWESILCARGPQEDREYLVRWLGYPKEFDLWVPRDNITGGEKALAEADKKWPSDGSTYRTDTDDVIDSEFIPKGKEELTLPLEEQNDILHENEIEKNYFDYGNTTRYQISYSTTWKKYGRNCTGRKDSA